jgi:hypothetical protein
VLKLITIVIIVSITLDILIDNQNEAFETTSDKHFDQQQSPNARVAAVFAHVA